MKLTEIDSRASVAIFGVKGVRNMASIDASAGLPKGTCSRYQESPQSIPLARFAAICEGMGKTDQEIVRAVKSFYRKGRQ